jgi:hypothetical protein
MKALVELAERYLTLTRELEETRSAMKAILMNGAGDEQPRPTQGSLRKAASQSQGRFVNARAADEQVLALLRTRPMRSVEIVKATSGKTSTVSERLRRLRQKGLVEPCEGGGWTATSQP